MGLSWAVDSPKTSVGQPKIALWSYLGALLGSQDGSLESILGYVKDKHMKHIAHVDDVSFGGSRCLIFSRTSHTILLFFNVAVQIRFFKPPLRDGARGEPRTPYN